MRRECGVFLFHVLSRFVFLLSPPCFVVVTVCCLAVVVVVVVVTIKHIVVVVPSCVLFLLLKLSLLLSFFGVPRVLVFSSSSRSTCAPGPEAGGGRTEGRGRDLREQFRENTELARRCLADHLHGGEGGGALPRIKNLGVRWICCPVSLFLVARRAMHQWYGVERRRRCWCDMRQSVKSPSQNICRVLGVAHNRFRAPRLVFVAFAVSSSSR